MSDPLSASQKNPELSINKPRHPLETPLEPVGPQKADQQPQPSVRITPYAVSKPTLTYALIVINLLIFAVDWLVLQNRLTDFGMKINEAIVAGQYWRFITPVFLHANPAHVVMNCISLYYIGRQVEAVYGSFRFSVIYILSGIAGVVLSFALLPNPSLGASGAIFGLIGALLLFLYRNRTVLNTRGAIRQVVIVIGIQIAAGLISQVVDNAGHIGGLLCGIGLGWFMTPLFKIEPDYTGGAKIKDGSISQTVWLAAGAGLLILAGAGQLVITLYQMGILHLTSALQP